MNDTFNESEKGSLLFNKLNILNGEVETLKQSPSTGITHDKPETLGEYYLVRKAEEMINASSFLVGKIAAPNHTYIKGDTIVGLPYSSTRLENTFVPNHVSFETYFTALADSDSYAYTKNPGQGKFGNLYYGVVCGVFACYCLGIKALRHLNWDMFGIPGMEKLEVQDAQSMRIGYLMNVGNGIKAHVRVCVGITRNSGVVTNLRMAHSTDPICEYIDYTAEEFNEQLSQGYVLMKYTKLEQNTYNASKSAYVLPFINPNLMPKKGNKSNWSASEDVKIDIIDKGSFTQYVVAKDGIAGSATSIGNATMINLGHMPYGKYSMYLTDGTTKSDPVEWIVVDMQMTAEAISGGTVRFTYSSKNATPIACCWGRQDYMLNLVYDISKEDISKGYKDTFLSQEPVVCDGVSGYEGQGSQYEKFHAYYTTEGNKIWPRMFFETEFGIISTDWPNSTITYLD